MADFKIALEELEIKMFLGLHDFERVAPQRVLVSAEIAVTGFAGSARDYFDYDRVADHIRSFAGQHIETQEELVMRIHRFITGLEGVTGATVASKKPDVYPDARAVGVVFSG